MRKIRFFPQYVYSLWGTLFFFTLALFSILVAPYRQIRFYWLFEQTAKNIPTQQHIAMRTPTHQPTPVFNESLRLNFDLTLQDLAFSPSGNEIALAGKQGIALYSLKIQKMMWTNPLLFPTNRIAFSNDGNLIATASDDQRITLWDTLQERRKQVLSGLPSWASSVAFSPQGGLIAGGSYKTITLWDTTHWQKLAQFQAHQSYIWGLAFSPQGNYLASASTDQTVNIWQIPPNLQNNNLITLKQTLRGSTYWVRSAAFSPDGKYLAAASGDGNVYLWDISSGKRLHTLKGHEGYVWKVTFASFGDLLVSAAEDGKVIGWDWKKGQKRFSFQEDNAVISLDVSNQGKLAAGLRDGTLIVWDIQQINESGEKR